MPTLQAIPNERSPNSLRAMPRVNLWGKGCVIFFTTEIYLTTLVSNFFHLTNYWFGLTRGSLGSKGDPKPIFFITEACATRVIGGDPKVILKKL